MSVHLVDGFYFRGYLGAVDLVKALPGEKVQLDYDNRNPTESNIAAAAARLRGQLADGDVCVGVSMGAQVLARMLRDAGKNKIVNDLRVLLLANPEQKWTGRVRTPQYGGLGVPVDIPADTQVTSLAAQYDFWADSPNLGGWIPTMWSWMVGNGVHTTGYFHLDPALPYPFIQEGNIKHMWAPYTGNVWLGRDRVEKGYQRPVKLQ